MGRPASGIRTEKSWEAQWVTPLLPGLPARRRRCGCDRRGPGLRGASGRPGREDAALDPPPEAHEVVHGVAVGNVGDVLVDYGASAEVGGDVVGGSADGLTPLSCARR